LVGKDVEVDVMGLSCADWLVANKYQLIESYQESFSDIIGLRRLKGSGVLNVIVT
jgi:hypothetical protein